MDKIESIEQFYQRKYGWMPDNIRNGLGHFNVFKLQPIVGKDAPALPYRRRDFYKVSLVLGNNNIHYADKVIEVKERALVFSNPQIPYSWEHLDRIQGGYYCVFNQQMFHQFGNLNQYSLFQPNGTHVYELTAEQAEIVSKVFERMFEELNSEYVHKYDVLRNQVFELLHFAMKMQPATHVSEQTINASTRITTLFWELLERQFPIDDTHQRIGLRSASEFAEQLNIHVNHLNRAVKETAQKTTSQVIAERIIQEAKVLLKHSSWNVSEIAYALGFAEVTHFNNFFKKHVDMSPLKFRNV